jgi:glucan phosphoethanolaminetransferase (alkaline phosphatase superfamily)
MTSLAACLLVVLVVAKVIVLAGRTIGDPVLAPFVFLWQDIAVVLSVALLERFVKPRWPVRGVYVALVLLAIVNVPVIRALSSPITARMLDATGGALSESLWHYATFTNIASMVTLAGLGAGLPFVRSAVWPQWLRAGRAWVAAGVVLCVSGWIGGSRVDTRGLERNTAVALVMTSLPRVHGRGAEEEWRAPIHGWANATEDLTSLRRAGRGKNVLLVVLESTGAAYLRAYGAAADPTPNLTALASRSIIFENAYSVYPESVKGMVATLAAQYPAFDIPAADHATAMRTSIARVLNGAGYATAIFHSGRFMYLGMEELLATSGFAQMEDAGAIGGNRESSFGIDEPAAVGRILTWIDSIPRDRPFFAAYLPVAGHHPYAYSTHGPFPDSTDQGRYLNALHEGDTSLGTLLTGLRSRGLDTSTLVVVVGDHGEAFGQHEGNFGHTLEIYEENIRVPMMFVVPGASPRRIRRVASLIDLAPTILDLSGITAPREYQGISLLEPEARMALFFTDYSRGLVGARDGCTKLVYELASRRTRAFDVCNDPTETRAITLETSPYSTRLERWIAAQVARITW